LLFLENPLAEQAQAVLSRLVGFLTRSA